MIVSDNNALNSYLRTPPYFGGDRGVRGVFEITPPRALPSVIQERETDQPIRQVDERHGGRERQNEQAAVGGRSPSRSAARPGAAYAGLPELRLAKPGQRELDAHLSSQAQIRTRLAHSGFVPRQMVIAGGHAFDSAAQARATLNASKVHRQRRSQAQHDAGSRRPPLQ